MGHSGGIHAEKGKSGEAPPSSRKRESGGQGRRGSGEQECECVPRHSGGILAVRRMSDAGPGACMRKPLGGHGCHWERTLPEGTHHFRQFGMVWHEWTLAPEPDFLWFTGSPGSCPI